MEKDILKFSHDILEGKRDIKEFNDTIIVLIPNIKEPKDMYHYRPISLCKFVNNMISKVFANRLKLLLSGCISQNQSTFVPKRMIHDSILIAHPLMHYLQSSKNGMNKSFAIKLDMSKGYDKVE